MRKPTFLQGVLLAVVLSFFASALFATLTPVMSTGFVARLLIALLSGAYIVYLLSRSDERTGRVTVVILWSLIAGAAWFFVPTLLLYLTVHLGIVWLVRSLYFYSGCLPALLDLGLCLLSLATSVWAASRSGSVFLTIWCFFLVQALFVAIPASIRRLGDTPLAPGDDDQAFERAYRTAETALRKISLNS